jgi:hypothetical protein
MDILIESTKKFEDDLSVLIENEKVTTIQKINDCVSRFSTPKKSVDTELNPPANLSNLNGYESSLYTLKISEKLGVILAIDEDPIFEQIIFTLYRAVKQDDLDQAYKRIAESLYQELSHHQENVLIS